MMKTDKALKIDVVDELTWDASVDSEQIGVEVKNGVVTLNGYVERFVDKWNAEKAVEKVAGVRALVIDIDVHLPGLSERTDYDIALAAENILLWSSHIATESVNLVVENGWITLQGEVEHDYQRRGAAAALSHLAGVRGILNHLTVKPMVCSEDVQAQIKAALKRRGFDSTVDVTVSVNGAQVTLEGQVQTWSDRNLARHSAWNTAGVKQVFDHLTVAD
ncbi:BON domain-containing protein [Pseudomonas sp. RIT-To-2]|uniref:BON domain-containing protein n=1 Tax=Pseudomonas sp. RIT-To-2 TaxID=3462541 RepID=UPI0024132029